MDGGGQIPGFEHPETRIPGSFITEEGVELPGYDEPGIRLPPTSLVLPADALGIDSLSLVEHQPADFGVGDALGLLPEPIPDVDLDREVGGGCIPEEC